MSPLIFIIGWQLIVAHLIYHNLSYQNYSSSNPPKSNFAGAGVGDSSLEDNDKS